MDLLIITNLLNLLYLFSIGTVKATEIRDLDYSRLEFLGVSCYPNDTCDSGLTLPFYTRKCHCDFLCQLYNDCCIDANRVVSRRVFQRGIQGIECIGQQSPSKGVYIISKCHTNYKGPSDIRDNCENFNDISSNPSDPLTAAPVTDILLNVTYKNRYCAECNHARPQDLRSWGVTVECKDVPDNTSIPRVDAAYIQDNLVYVETDESRNSWGFFHKPQNNPNSENHFYPCSIPFVLPDALKDYVRECVPNVVSTCASSWRRNLHHTLCQAYMALVFIDHKIYRNPDCAYCNMKDLEKLECNIPEFSVTGRRPKPAMSFTLLLDVNMSDGNRVGEIRDNRCSDREKWDPFFRKCRALVCAIPGYRMRGNRCVRP